MLPRESVLLKPKAERDPFNVLADNLEYAGFQNVTADGPRVTFYFHDQQYEVRAASPPADAEPLREPAPPCSECGKPMSYDKGSPATRHEPEQRECWHCDDCGISTEVKYNAVARAGVSREVVWDESLRWVLAEFVEESKTAYTSDEVRNVIVRAFKKLNATRDAETNVQRIEQCK